MFWACFPVRTGSFPVTNKCPVPLGTEGMDENEYIDRRGGLLAGDDQDNYLVRTKEHCLMGVKGQVKRGTDVHLVHANIDIDLITEEEPRETGPELYPSNDGKTPSFGRVFPSKPGFFPSQTKIFRSPLGT